MQGIRLVGSWGDFSCFGTNRFVLLHFVGCFGLDPWGGVIDWSRNVGTTIGDQVVLMSLMVFLRPCLIRWPRLPCGFLAGIVES
jgi:hypothetical protein